MSDSIRQQVQSIVGCASVSYSTLYCGQTKREEWDCDALQDY